MAYTKQNFTDGTVLEAEHLNNIEDQIAANEAAVEGKADKEHTHDNVVSLEDGTKIEPSTDLNTIIAIGNYKCTIPSDPPTLINCPTTQAFKMTVSNDVLLKGGTYKVQEIIDVNGDTYWRYTADNGVNWNDWQYRFTDAPDTSVEIGAEEHMECCQRFVDEMNRVAASIGMTNSTFATPSGLPRKPINVNDASASISYNSYTTAYDLLRLLIAARHTPFVLSAMGTAAHTFKSSKLNKNVTHTVLGSSVWKEWASTNNYTILGSKGGSLDRAYGEIGKSGILDSAILVKDANDDIYGVAVVGLQNPSTWSESTTYAAGDRVLSEGITYISLADNNLNHAITDTNYWKETTNERDVLRTLIHDLIEMVGGASVTTAITEAIERPYPVGMAAVKLTVDGDFDADIEQLSSGAKVCYNQDAIRVAASTAKILNAIVVASQFDNHYCTVNIDDLVGGSGLDFNNGDTVTTYDAMYAMMLLSDNAMATLLARDCGKRMSEVTKKWVTNEIASVSGTVSETWVNNQIQTAVAQKAEKVHTHEELQTQLDNKVSKYPTLTSTQKKQLQSLANAYYALNAGLDETGPGTFMYYGNRIRNSYANNACWVETEEVEQEDGSKIYEERKKFGLCCNTFVEMVWMGRDPIDFKNKDNTTYSNKITFWEDANGVFDWGYYPEFKRRTDIAGLARRNESDGALRTDMCPYYNYKQPNSEDTTDPYKNSYSTNTYYDPKTNQPYKQWFASMQTQDELGLELERKGYGIPIEELDVGDLIFTTIRGENSTEYSEFTKDRTWKECGHVSIIYDKATDGTLTIIECTPNLNKLNSPIVKSSTGMKDIYNKIRAEELLGNIVFCARHPVAWGHSNMDVTLHSDGNHYIDYQLMAYQDGNSNNAIPVNTNESGDMISTTVQTGKYYVYENNISIATADATTTSFTDTCFDKKWYNNATEI